VKAEKAGYLKQMDAAMRDGETAQAQIAEANAQKAQAQIDLYEYMVGQAKLLSPLSGTVVQGDLKRQIGAPVKMGDTLFEVTPLESLRAVLHVREDQITDVQVGQQGPWRPLRTPASTSRSKSSVSIRSPRLSSRRTSSRFVCGCWSFVSLDAARHGSVAKIDLVKRSYAWIWTRKIINWVRMKLWI